MVFRSPEQVFCLYLGINGNRSVHDLRGLGFVSDTLKGGEIKVGEFRE